MSYSSEVLADSPLLYWPMNSGGADASGNSRPADGGVNGTSVAGLLPSTSDLAVQFNGSSQYLTRSYAAWMNTSAITLECWVKTSTTSQSILVSRDNGSSVRPFQLKIEATTGLVSFVRIQNAAGTVAVVTASSVTAVNDNVAHHVVVTYDGTTCLIYIDGTLNSTTSISAGLRQPGSQGIDVARYTPTTNTYYAGVLDELAWYGTVLSSTRIAAHYAAGVAVTLSASGSGSISLSGSAGAAGAGSASGAISLTGVAAAGAAAAAVGAISLTGTGGTVPPSPASASGAIDLSGSGATGVGVAASGSLALDGSATASATEAAAATGAITLAGTGSATLAAAASGSITFGSVAAAFALYLTDITNALNGRRRRGRATAWVDRPAAPPPGRALEVRYDKAIAYPVPTMAEGRPT